MAEAPGTDSAHVLTSESDALLATKLHVPRLRPGFVPRQRLVEQLDEALDGGLSLVCAPAGFGKSMLLAHWCHSREHAVAWLSLDAGDNDPVRFWRHAAAALDQVRPGIGERVAPLSGTQAPAAVEAFVTELINTIAAEPGDVVLVLDDYHVIEAESVHASLLFLLEHAPTDLHVALASRTDPPLPLARWRSSRQLGELRVAELRFTMEEAGALLQQALESDLPDDAIASLVERTEGWAVGIQLAALSLRSQPDLAGFVETFSGSHRYVLDYLTEEVLDRQPERVREFLLETSMLEQLSGDLCDAISGRNDSQMMLEEIERENLFLLPLDEARGWWRYHHLFADLLRTRLERQQPDRVYDLHRKAASWHDEHGLADSAIRHAIAADDTALAAQLSERHFDEHYLSSDRATVQRWLEALPRGLVASRPRLLLAEAALDIVGGRVEDVESSLNGAEHALADAADEPFEPSAGKSASRLVNVPAAIAVGRAYVAHFRGDEVATIAFGRRALHEVGDGEWMLGGLARSALAIAEWLGGRLEEAERAVIANIAWWRTSGDRDLTALTSSYLGRIQYTQGRLDAALDTYKQALKVAAPPGAPAQPAAGLAHVGLATVFDQRGEFDAAKHHLSVGLPLCRQFAYTLSLATGLVTLAWTQQAAQDLVGARLTMEEAERATDPTMADLFNPVPAQRARLLLAQGEIDAAARWTVERGLHPDAEPSFAHEAAYLALARVLLAQDQPDHALLLLDRMHVLALEQRRTASVIEIRALQALALAAVGDDHAAVAMLAEGLTLAHPQGYLRVFVDEGTPMAALLGRLIAAKRSGGGVAGTLPADYLGRLVQAFEPDATGPPRLVTDLSDRELQVLRLLAEGRTNQEIADKLYVALDTVKKHVTHIFIKLGVANRTEATTRARDLGLLE